jgi:hypothetical protein
MVDFKFCRIRGYKHIISIKEFIFKKWNKEREPLVMIKRPKDKILVLVMQRQNQMDTREKCIKKH